MVRNDQPRWAVIFDCDGVILDSEPIGLDTLAEVVKRFGLPIERPELDYYCGHSDIATYYDFVTKYGEFATAAEFIEAVDAAYMHALKELGMQVFPGVLTLVDQLAAQAIPYGIGTSGSTHKVTAGLTMAGIKDRFPVIVAGDEVAEAKPAPDIFLRVAMLLQVNPTRCVVIEDSPTGITAAQRAGMACVAVTTSFDASVLSQADLLVPSLTQLSIPVLERMCSVAK
ncbi:MAG TPA: HAD family phosphatase [Firmicutes bacterium]|nr:HAD family phosphatase [Bacillota bacterium]